MCLVLKAKFIICIFLQQYESDKDGKALTLESMKACNASPCIFMVLGL